VTLLAIFIRRLQLIKTNNQLANKKTAGDACEKFLRGGSLTVLRLLVVLLFIRRGGGYDPRLGQMQINMINLQNIYNNVDVYYTIKPDVVKRKS
jgi:hypothetical protein